MRTYLPLVVSICKVFCRTLNKYDAQIKKGKTPEFIALIETAKAACHALEVAADLLIPVPV